MVDNRSVEKVETPRSQDDRPTIGWLTQTEVNTLSSALWKGAEREALEQGANLLSIHGDILSSPIGFLGQANALYDLVSADVFDGLVMWGGLLSQYISLDEFRAFCDQYRPLPLVNIGVPIEGVPSLWVDNYAGMRDAVNHLVREHGYRRIAFVRGVAGPEGEDRYRAYADVLAERGIRLDLNLVTPHSDQQREDGVRGIRLLLDERKVTFDAVVASTDAMAFGVISELQARGIDVPGDVAVIGFDDVEESASITPSLSTVRQPLYDLSKQAVQMLLALIAGEKVASHLVLPAELVVRQSCGCVGASIEQVEGQPAVASSGRRSAVDAFRVGMAAQRHEILSALEQELGGRVEGLGPSWAKNLLDAFSSEVQGRTKNAFLAILDKMLRQIMIAGGNVAAWQGVISTFRLRMLQTVSGNAGLLLQSENLWQQARVMVAMAAERASSYKAMEAQRQTVLVQDVGQALLNAENLADMVEVLAHELPRLGIQSCYLSLYESPEHPDQWSRLLLAYKDGERIGLDSEGLRFPSVRLVPDKSLSRANPYSMSLEPLYFRESSFGFALLEFGSWQSEGREQLRVHISSALQKALLAEEMADRAVQLQTAAEVSQAASGILDPDELVQQVVDLIRQRFALYYVGLFLVDEDAQEAPGSWAVLRAGTGPAGRRMVEQGHRLEVGGDSMIGRCVADGQSRIALDFGAEAVRFDNPLLPQTRSEMALPLIARGQVVGALTVQSSREAAFTKADVSSLEVMSRQVAIALENARLLREAQQSTADLAEERTLLRTLIDSLPDYVFVKDVKGRFILNNLAHLNALGVTSQQEIVGKADFDLFPEDMAVRSYADEQEIIASGQAPDAWEEPTLRSDGSTQWLLTSKVPLRDSAGNVTGLVGISRDITERRQTEMAVERHSAQLQAAAQVSRAASSVLDVDELLKQTVNLIRDEFDYYYVGLFLVDSDDQSVVLQAGTGDAGRAMLEQGHRFEVGSRSMIGRCVAEGQPRLATDVGEEVVRFDNPFLPETRSELALPLVSRGEVVGALTVQSAEASAFSEGDITLLQTMAGQVATSIQNARLLERTRSALSELEAAQRRYMRLAWTDYTTAEDAARGYVLAEEKYGLAKDEWLPSMTPALEQMDTVVERDEGDGATLALPLMVHGEVIGALGGYRPDGMDWTLEDIATAEAIVEQMALALENQRLFDEEQQARQLLDQRVKELDLLSEIGRKLDETPPISELLDWVAEQTPSAMQYPGLCAVAIDLEGNVYGEADALVLPCQMVQGLLVSGEQVGKVCIAYHQDRDFLDEESALLGDIARRVGGYVENRRLFELEQLRAEEQATLRRITEAVSGSLDMETLLNTALETLLVDMGFDAALISLSAEDTGRLYLASEKGLPEPFARKLDQDGLEGTLCDYVFQRRETVAIGDVREGAPVDVRGLIRLGLLGYMGALLTYMGESLGTICCFTYDARHMTPEEMSLLEGVGAQIGVGVANARLFQESQAALAEVEAVHRSYLRQAWQDHLRQQTALTQGGLLYDKSVARQPEDTRVIPDLWLPEMETALHEGKPSTSSGDGDDADRTGLAMPITVRGETIGVLGVEVPTGTREWSEEDQALIEAVGEQLGQALESARLFADTQRRAERERLIGEISAKIRASTDVRDILETTAVELGQALGTSRALIRLRTERSSEEAILAPEGEDESEEAGS